MFLENLDKKQNMQIEVHLLGAKKIAELFSKQMIISSVDDALELIGNLYYQDFDAILIDEQNICPEFFDLQNGMAGEILQKFSNYRLRAGIVGDFSKYEKKSFQDFMKESNKNKHINFVSSRDEGLKVLSL